MKFRKKLSPIGWSVVVTSLFWLLALAAPRVWHKVWFAGYPFFSSDVKFTDLTVFRPQFLRFRQPDFYVANRIPLPYPALAGVLLEVLFATKHELGTYDALVGICCAAALTAVGILLVQRGMAKGTVAALLAFVGVTSYPLYFCVLRANIEFFNCALMAAGIAFCWRRLWTWGGALLGLAVAFKLYPVVLLGFLLAQRQFRALAVAVAVACCATLASLVVLGPSALEAYQQIARGLQWFRSEYVVLLLRDSALFDHSIFGVYKLVVNHFLRPQAFNQAATVYSFAVVILGVGFYLMCVVKLPPVSQVAVLTTSAILLPPVSYDYTLLALYVPWTLLALEALKDTPGDRGALVWSFVCLALAMAPLTYLKVAAGPLRCLSLVALVALHCMKPVGNKWQKAPTPDKCKPPAPCEVLQGSSRLSGGRSGRLQR